MVEVGFNLWKVLKVIATLPDSTDYEGTHNIGFYFYPTRCRCGFCLCSHARCQYFNHRHFCYFGSARERTYQPTNQGRPTGKGGSLVGRSVGNAKSEVYPVCWTATVRCAIFKTDPWSINRPFSKTHLGHKLREGRTSPTLSTIQRECSTTN